MDELLGSFLRGNQLAEQRSSLPSFVICYHDRLANGRQIRERYIFEATMR
jgi:hypothetical protein